MAGEGGGSAFAIKKAPYEAVCVNVAPEFEPDTAYNTMLASLAAVAANDPLSGAARVELHQETL
jgi:hypothetical protein